MLLSTTLSGCISWGFHPTPTPGTAQTPRPKLKLTFEGKSIGDSDPDNWIKQVAAEYVDLIPGEPGPNEEHLRVEWHSISGPERLWGLFTLNIIPIYHKTHYGAYVEITNGLARKVGEAHAPVTFAMGPLLLPAVPFVWIKDINTMRRDLLRVALSQALSSQQESAPQPLRVNNGHRGEVINFYKAAYLASNDSGEWVPGGDECDPGQNSVKYYKATALRINYFRAMAGVPADIEDRKIYNHLSQQAAIIIRANNEADHLPSILAKCYSEDGAIAAAQSNLSPGRRGPKAIHSQIHDWGDENYAVGHRRWLLNPRTKFMGLGSTDRSSAFLVFGGYVSRWIDPPPTAVMWPPAGYVPYEFGFAPNYRWSLSYPGANFSSATVSVKCDGVPVNVRIEPYDIGFGLNTLVWQPDLQGTQNLTSDISCVVNVGNVTIGNETRSFSYTTTFIDPNR